MRKDPERITFAASLLDYGFTYKETGALVNRHATSVFGWFSQEERRKFLRPADPAAREPAMKQHRRKWENKTKTERPIEYWAFNVKSRAKSRAETRRVPFDLTADYLISLYTRTQGECPVFKKPFTLFQKSSPFCPSLDCIIPAKGYVKGNVAVISAKANLIKSNATSDEIRAVADWLDACTS